LLQWHLCFKCIAAHFSTQHTQCFGQHLLPHLYVSSTSPSALHVQGMYLPCGATHVSIWPKHPTRMTWRGIMWQEFSHHANVLSCAPHNTT
jgi:hypothetical protein